MSYRNRCSAGGVNPRAGVSLLFVYSGGVWQVLAEQNLMCARNQELCSLDTEIADGVETVVRPLFAQPLRARLATLAVEVAELDEGDATIRTFRRGVPDEEP